MLTRGSFALFYGGDEILDELSTDTPFPTVLVVILLSAILQITLFILKKLKTRRNIKSYISSLKHSLVDNVTNVYGVIVITVTSVTCFLLAVHLFSDMKEKNNNKKYEKSHSPVPKGITIICSVNLFLVLLPYMKSYPLR